MISKVKINDFQSWKSLDLDLSAVNIIVGETNKGKSSILRALSAVLFNSIEGSSFVRKGSDNSRIEVLVDGHEIVLEKGKGCNRYLVDGLLLDKIGRAVPDPVQSALGAYEIELGEDRLQLQYQPQMDAPFLLSDQGVRATRLLGSVSKAGLLYQAAKLCGQKRKETTQELVTLKRLEQEAKNKLDSHKYLDILIPKVGHLQHTSSALDTALDEEKRLSIALDRTDSLKYQVVRAGIRVYAFEKRANNLSSLYAARVSISEIAKVFHIVTDLSKNLGQLNSLIELKIKFIAMADRQKDTIEILMALKEFMCLRKESLESAAKEIGMENRVEEIRQELNRLISEISCPICGKY